MIGKIFNSTAVVFGNGPSRLTFNSYLPLLSKLFTIYGCNALYRDFTVDHLVSVDELMVDEIVESGYHTTCPVYTHGKHIKPFPNTYKKLCLFPTHSFGKWYSSGPMAIWLAAHHGNTTIYNIGFDYHDRNGTIKNVYAGTKNYKPTDSVSPTHISRINEMDEIISMYPAVEFIHVIKHNNTEFLNTPASNFTRITQEEFFLEVIVPNFYFL